VTSVDHLYGSCLTLMKKIYSTSCVVLFGSFLQMRFGSGRFCTEIFVLSFCSQFFLGLNFLRWSSSWSLAESTGPYCWLRSGFSVPPVLLIVSVVVFVFVLWLQSPLSCSPDFSRSTHLFHLAAGARTMRAGISHFSF
jgi:hypothetical protein